MFALLLVACTATDSTTAPHGEVLGTLPTDTDTDTDTDTGSPADSGVEEEETYGLAIRSESFRCAPGEHLDVNLPIPVGSVVQSFVLVDDEAGYLWLSSADGVVEWSGGMADLNCTWTPGPVGESSFWSEYPDRVVAVRVVWVSGG
jgi:hypothetical protein